MKMDDNNIIKAIGAAVVVLVGSFLYFYRKGNTTKGIADTKVVRTLSYEDIILDVKDIISKNPTFQTKNLSLKLLANNSVYKLQSYLKSNNIPFETNGKNHVGLILLTNNNPIYVCLYTYDELTTDLKDIFSSNEIFAQEID